MIVKLIAALQAAETLATYHLQRVKQTTGTRQAYHWSAAKCAQDDIDDIKYQLGGGGATSENQALAMRSRDVTAAQRIIDAHILPEWCASDHAMQALLALAQAIADALQAARGGHMAEVVQLVRPPGARR
jgi:hypothetical protein